MDRARWATAQWGYSLGLRIKVEWQTCTALSDSGLTMRVLQCSAAGVHKTAFFSLWLEINSFQVGSESFAERLIVILNL